MTSSSSKRRGLLGLGLYLVLLVGMAIAVACGPFAAHRSLVQSALMACGLAWATIVWMSLYDQSFLGGRLASFWVFGGALLLRCVVGLGDPLLSDDVHRYVWEGGLVAEGISPYAWPPDHPVLKPYRENWNVVYTQMNNKDVSAAYPPFSQAVFAAVTSLSGGPAAGAGRSAVGGMRLAFGGFDLLLLVLLLWRFRDAPARAVVWGWSPLVALEFAGSAHFDSLGILLLLGAVLCFERGTSFAARGYGLLALGMLVKILPILVFPFSSQRRRSLWAAGLSIGILLGLSVLPLFWLEGGFGGLTAGISQYALRWESFSLLHRPIRWFLDRYLEGDYPWIEAGQVPRLVSLALLAGLALWAWRRRQGPVSAGFLLIGGFLLLSPTLHPWYLTWLIPFLAFRPSPAWTLLLVLAPLLYWPLTEWQANGVWIEPGWLWPSICLPFFALLILETRHSGRLHTKDVVTFN